MVDARFEAAVLLIVPVPRTIDPWQRRRPVDIGTRCDAE